MSVIQNIHIRHLDCGRFSILHKYMNFTEEGYIVKSKSGLVPVIRNLINGYKPDSKDLYLPEGVETTSIMEKAKPLD